MQQLRLEKFQIPPAGEDPQYDQWVVDNFSVETFDNQTGEQQILTGKMALFHTLDLFLRTASIQDITRKALDIYFALMSVNDRVVDGNIRIEREEARDIIHNPSVALTILLWLFSPDRLRGIRERMEQFLFFTDDERLMDRPSVDITLDEFRAYEKMHVPCAGNNFTVPEGITFNQNEYNTIKGYEKFLQGMREFYGK